MTYKASGGREGLREGRGKEGDVKGTNRGKEKGTGWQKRRKGLDVFMEEKSLVGEKV